LAEARDLPEYFTFSCGLCFFGRPDRNQTPVSELVKHFLATALLTVVRIQDFEPNGGIGGIRRELVFGNNSLKVFLADCLK
jgi:hypothetical protein